MDTPSCPNCGANHNDTESENLGIALETLRSELEYLWPAEERDGAQKATAAVSRAVGGLSLELDYLWPNAA